MGVRARKLRLVLRTPAGNDRDIELTTENDGPLLTEASWVSSCPPGSVLETEASHA